MMEPSKSDTVEPVPVRKRAVRGRFKISMPPPPSPPHEKETEREGVAYDSSLGSTGTEQEALDQATELIPKGTEDGNPVRSLKSWGRQKASR
ncbi:MAG: hypothetical protein V2I33_20210, partial [Kangiellaceae bacterium]|nr:hypothetical protein [Kangiellaceae bacterium]